MDNIYLRQHQNPCKCMKKWYNKDMDKQISLSVLDDELLQV